MLNEDREAFENHLFEKEIIISCCLELLNINVCIETTLEVESKGNVIVVQVETQLETYVDTFKQTTSETITIIICTEEEDLQGIEVLVAVENLKIKKTADL